MRKITCTLVVLCSLMLLSIPAFACDGWCDWWERDDGNVIDLGEVPDPGLPESIKCNAFKCYISTPADFTVFGNAKIFSFNRLSSNRTIELAFEIPPVVPVAPNALSGIAIKGHNLYVVQVNGPVEQVVKINMYTGIQEPYSNPIPDLVPCFAGVEGDCSPSLPCSAFAPFGMMCTEETGRPPLANSLAFGPDGSLYVSDTFQATIWEIPPGGGAPEIWFQDEEFEAPYGTNGLAYKNGYLYVAVTGPFGFYGAKDGAIYKIPIEGGNLETFWEFNGGFPFGPDEMSISPDGNVYLTGSLSSMIAKISPEGDLLQLYQNELFQNPAGIFFEPFRCSVYVVNHALLVTDPYYGLFDMFVGETF